MLNRIPHWFCLFCNKFFYLSGSSSGSLFRSGLLCSHSWWVYLPKRCSAACFYVIISRFMGQSGSKAWLRSIGRACAAAGTPARVKGKLLRNRHQSYMKPRHAKLDNLTNEKCHLTTCGRCWLPLWPFWEKNSKQTTAETWKEGKARKVIILCLHAVRITLCRLFKLPNVVMKRFHYANIFAASCWKIGSHYKKFSYQKAGLGWNRTVFIQFSFDFGWQAIWEGIEPIFYCNLIEILLATGKE